MKDDREKRDDDQEARDAAGQEQNDGRDAEMRAINERLVIAGVRQQEYAESAQEAERLARAALEQLTAAHNDLNASQSHLRATLAAVQAAYDREHRIAQALQRPLTMEAPEDAFPGLTVATLYSAAWEEAEVGGDFYDAIPLPDGRTAFVVGDASGKGITAAARAMEVKDVLRAFLRLYPSYPALTMTRLSDYLCDNQSLDEQSEDTFFAMCLVVISARTSEAVFVRAGIEAPILVRAGGSGERIVAAGLPLGIYKGQHYTDVTVEFLPGDMILLSTDGLSEARHGQEFLGEEGVNALVGRSLWEKTLRGIGTAILAGARKYAGGKLTDDACLVLVRRK